MTEPAVDEPWLISAGGLERVMGREYVRMMRSSGRPCVRERTWLLADCVAEAQHPIRAYLWPRRVYRDFAHELLPEHLRGAADPWRAWWAYGDTITDEQTYKEHHARHRAAIALAASLLTPPPGVDPRGWWEALCEEARDAA